MGKPYKIIMVGPARASIFMNAVFKNGKTYISSHGHHFSLIESTPEGVAELKKLYLLENPCDLCEHRASARIALAEASLSRARPTGR